MAAVGTLLLSRLPEIVLREGFAVDAPWLRAIPVAAAAALWLGSYVVVGLRPLTGYFGAMAGITAFILAIEALFTSALWNTLAPESAGPIVRLLSERLVLGTLAVALAVAMVRFSGGSPTYLRLRAGGANALEGQHRESAVRWRRRGPVAIVVLVSLTALAMAPFVPGSIDLGASAPFLTMAVLAAALNSLWEEVAFRAVPLGSLAPVLGAAPAIVILAVWFGLGHFYGGLPSGAAGAVIVAGVGLVLGRAMADTRGLAWPWAIHFAIDLTIYVVLALGATASA
jgi:membrane protease YdiL (CAAX protease family)